MRRKLLVGVIGVAATVLAPAGVGTAGSTQALDCPVGQLETACGVAGLVLATVCSDPTPDIPTVGFITIKIEGGQPVACPVS